jgi:16S rRNA U516 pseudouridylate synthase RsuA-like enzyme
LSGIPDEDLYISAQLNILADKATPEEREEIEQEWENMNSRQKTVAINQIKGEVARINKEREQRLQELREGAKLAKADTAPKQDPKNASLIKDAESYIDTLIGKNLIAGVTLTEQKAHQVKQIIAKMGNDASAVANAAIATLVANDLGRVLKQTANQTKQAMLKDATLSNIQSSRPQGDGLSTQPIDQKAERQALIAKQAEERINKFFSFSS